jgi:hypothetical protein
MRGVMVRESLKLANTLPKEGAMSRIADLSLLAAITSVALASSRYSRI